MTTVGRCILLGAKIEDIYAVLADASQIPTWFESIDKISATDNFPDDGSMLEVVFKHGEVVLNYTMTVVEFVEGEYTIFKLDGDLVGTQRWTTTPERGGYRLSIDYEYDLPTRGLNKFVERITRETLKKSLKNLKAMIETKRVPAYF